MEIEHKKFCKVCAIDFVPTFTRRLTCCDQCSEQNKKDNIKKRNDSKPYKYVKKLEQTDKEQEQARFMNKFLVRGFSGK